MQVLSKPDTAAHFDRILAKEVPGGRGLRAWDALLRAHATLLRQLETDLESKTGLALADFDVLAQLAIAGGSLRMTELADRALISRSGMTRRVTRLVRDGLGARIHGVERRATPDLNRHETRGHVGNRAARDDEACANSATGLDGYQMLWWWT